MQRPMILWTVFLSCLFSVYGCNTTRFMVDGMVPVTEHMKHAVNQNPDIDMVESAMPAGIIQLEGLVSASPENKALLLQLSEAYYGYAYSFVEQTDPERAGRLYMKANEYALRAVRLNHPDFAGALERQVDEFTPMLSELDESDVHGLFFLASSWLGWVGVNLEDPEIFLALPKIKAMAERVVELDETFYYGGAHAMLGAYHASRGEALGGSPEKARYHFKRAIDISDGKFLSYYLLYAQYYAYQVQDRELYVQTLQKIVNAPRDILPERRFINEVARQKAQNLLATVDEVF